MSPGRPSRRLCSDRENRTGGGAWPPHSEGAIARLRGLFFRARPGYFMDGPIVMNPLVPAAQRRFLAMHKRPCVIFRRMTRSECLKRSVECCRLAEAASEPEMKVYLMRLALPGCRLLHRRTSACSKRRSGCMQAHWATEGNATHSFLAPAFRERLHRGFDRSLVAARWSAAFVEAIR